MTVTIRLGTPDDVPELFELLCEFHAQTPHFPEIDIDRALVGISAVVAQGMPLIVEADGRIAGSLGLIPQSPWYSADRVLADRWFYVRPEFRGRGAANKLVGGAKKVARDVGLPLWLSSVSGHKADLFDGFMRRADLRRVGGVYVRI
jgi:GNAT superfamily N-acetyltransferase